MTENSVTGITPPKSIIVTPSERVSLQIECDSRDVVCVAGNLMWTCCTCGENLEYDVSMHEHLFTKHQIKKGFQLSAASSSEKNANQIFSRLDTMRQQYPGDFKQFNCLLKKLIQMACLFKDLYPERAHTMLEEILSSIDSDCQQAQEATPGSSRVQLSSSPADIKKQPAQPDLTSKDFEDIDSYSFPLSASALEMGADNHAVDPSSGHLFGAESWPAAQEGTKGNGRFLDLRALLKLFRGGEQPFEQIPKGKKQDVIYVVSNAENTRRKENGQGAMFIDDCGAWTGASSTTKDYCLVQGDTPRHIYYRDGLYYSALKGKKTVILDPQPDESEVLVLRKYYSALRDAPNYRRRITAVVKYPSHFQVRDIFIVEYIGEPPNMPAPHRNCKKTSSPYIRTTASAKRKMEELIATSSEPPSKLYQQMVKEDAENSPRHSKQVRVAKFLQSRRMHSKDEVQTQNSDVDIQTFVSSVSEHPSIKKIIQSGGQTPTFLVVK